MKDEAVKACIFLHCRYENDLAKELAHKLLSANSQSGKP